MRYFYGKNKKNNYFEGWYFKHQSDEITIALIVGIKINNKNDKTAFIQIITNTNTYNIDYDFSLFKADKTKLHILVASNKFTEEGITLDITTPDVSLKGKLNYCSLNALKYDIMGPLKLLPKLECKHGILSMYHYVNGSITLNNKVYVFTRDYGYIEKDYGRLFPKKYTWTQSALSTKDICSISVACAIIPYLKIDFSGFYAVILWHKKEYRLCSYLGGKILYFSNNKLILKQRKYLLIIELIKDNKLPLKAPSLNGMHRTVHESAICIVRYQFYINQKEIFDYISHNASFEA